MMKKPCVECKKYYENLDSCQCNEFKEWRENKKQMEVNKMKSNIKRKTLFAINLIVVATVVSILINNKIMFGLVSGITIFALDELTGVLIKKYDLDTVLEKTLLLIGIVITPIFLLYLFGSNTLPGYIIGLLVGVFVIDTNFNIIINN